MNDLLVLVLVVALVAALAAVGSLLLYRARHPWTDADLEAARQDALARSRSVVSGKVQEHLAPMLPDFGYNPRDARFLGSPVDFVVFDGLDEGGPVRAVVFVEVKTGRASLTPRERLVRDAVEAGRVGWQVLRLAGAPAEAEGVGA